MPPMTWQMVAATATILVGLGVFYGDVRARLSRIEKAIFNGQFIPRHEAEAMIAASHAEHKRIQERLDRIEQAG